MKDPLVAITDGLHDAFEEGYKQGKADAMTWIPVSERLPKHRETVIVDWWNIHCPERHNFSVMRFYKGKTADEVDPYKGIEFCDQWGNNRVPYAWADPHSPLQLFGQDVTHWMPLPETNKPPKDGEA